MNLFSPSLCIVAELPTGSPESNRFNNHNTVFSVYVLLKKSRHELIASGGILGSRVTQSSSFPLPAAVKLCHPLIIQPPWEEVHFIPISKPKLLPSLLSCSRAWTVLLCQAGLGSQSHSARSGGSPAFYFSLSQPRAMATSPSVGFIIQMQL